MGAALNTTGTIGTNIMSRNQRDATSHRAPPLRPDNRTPLRERRRSAGMLQRRRPTVVDRVRSVIALSHEYHDRANLSVGGKPQLSYRS